MPRRHTLYVELFGKGGLWGLGYDLQIGRTAVGFTASFSSIDGTGVSTLSPYVLVYVAGRGRHRLFTHGGPQVVRIDVDSPVPEWPGATDTGVGGELALGYEYRNRLVVRVYMMASAGKHGVAPWGGISIGVCL